MTRLTHGRIPGLRRGMGALYTDTGGGITPANFAAMCCTGPFGTYPNAGSGNACDQFAQANVSLFGDETICSPASIANLTMPPPVTSVATVAPPASAYTASTPVYVPLVTCPYSPCPCDGRLVVTSQDAADLLTCQALAQSVAQGTAVQTQMNANAVAQCVAQAATCTGNTFLTKMSTDCTTCGIDLTNPSLWLGIAAVGITVFALARGFR